MAFLIFLQSIFPEAFGELILHGNAPSTGMMLWKCQVQITAGVWLEKRERVRFVVIGCAEH